MNAKVLRLLREDARMWWWHAQLRKMGNTAEAARLERASIRNHVRDIRDGLHRPVTTYRTSVIEFTDTLANGRRPFDLQVEEHARERTVSMSGCHPGFFAAFVYCYANRIGLKYQAKSSDRV